MYVYRTLLILKPPRLCFSVTKNFCSQSPDRSIADTKDFSDKNQLNILEKCVSPELFQYLTLNRSNLKSIYQKKGQFKVAPSLFDKIMLYKNDYVEKTLLISEETAEQIAHNIAVHTRGNKSTTFFDGEGGLCQVAAAVDRLDIFKKVAVLEKDNTFTDLHNYAKEHYIDPRTEIHQVNLVMSASNSLTQKQGYQSSFARLLPVGKAEEFVPSTSVVTTASHGLIKYLTLRRLNRDNPLGEFYSSRPEFFLIVTGRTYFHMCCSYRDQLEPVTSRVSEQEMRDWIGQVPKAPKLTLTYNVMFQMLFDFCLVDILPRTAYFPWKPYSEHPTSRGLGKKPKLLHPDKMTFQHHYERQHDNLMLVYARPKLDSEVQISRPDYLEFFLRQVLKNKKQLVVNLFESWVTGSGIKVVEAGFTIFTEVKDLDIDQLLEMFKLLLEIPGFKQSNFVVEAEIFRKSSDIEVSDTDKSTETMKTQLKRQLAMGRVLSGNDLDDDYLALD